MAALGLYNFYYCKYTVTEDGYGNEIETLAAEGALIAKGIKRDENPQYTPIELFATNGMSESRSEFASGTLSLECDDLPDETAADLFGSGMEDGRMISGTEDTPPFCLVGSIHGREKKKVKTYVATIYQRCQFTPPTESRDTKARGTGYGTTTIVGNLSRNADGNWRERKTFDTFAEAQAYVFAALNIPIPTVVVGELAGGALQVGAATTGRSYTVTADNIMDGAKATVKWYSTSTKTARASSPAGVTIAPTGTVEDEEVTLGVTASSSAMVAGSYYFTVTIAGVESAVVTLAILAAA